MTFTPPIILDVINFITSEVWRMYSVDASFGASEADFERIKTICNEPLIYQWLFKENLQGKVYSLEKAKGFVRWAQEGWKNQTHFVFLIRDTKGEIQAAIDIKSNNLELAEVGYWASADKPGIMTNAVIALVNLATEAGYKKLFFDVQVNNLKSVNVLKRTGFDLEKEFEKEGKKYFRYIFN